MTIIFNVFVIYTLFNQINCRIINDSFNIFKRITRSILFPLITLLEMILQIIIVCFGKSIFHVANNGLTGEQWGYCFGFSAITFIVSIIAKFLKIEKCFKSNDLKEEKNDNDVLNIVSSANLDKFEYIEVKRKKEKKDILPNIENNSSTSNENEDTAESYINGTEEVNLKASEGDIGSKDNALRLLNNGGKISFWDANLCK